MDKEFYNLAVKLMDNIRQLEPNLVSSRDAELCVLMTESEQIYAGITGVKISAGQLMRACPEYNAIMAMIPEGESRVRKLITVSFAHREVSPEGQSRCGQKSRLPPSSDAPRLSFGYWTRF